MIIIQNCCEILSRLFTGSKMSNPSIKAEKRKILGRKVKKLREEGDLPANIYGKKIKSQAIVIKQKDFAELFKQAGETGLIDVILEGKKRPALIHNVQTDPVTDDVLHADLLQVDLKQKVVAQVPVELIGESPAEKEGGTVVQHIDEIEVEALPMDLPDKFEIDLSSLKEIDSTHVVSDINVDKAKVEVKNDPEQIIVKVEPPRKEEEVIEPPKEEGEEEVAEGDETEAEEVETSEKPKEEVKQESPKEDTSREK